MALDLWSLWDDPHPKTKDAVMQPFFYLLETAVLNFSSSSDAAGHPTLAEARTVS